VTAHGDVIVIGAGVSGLCTAIVLAEAGHPVRVIAADPPRSTTSAVAGALWGPGVGGPADATERWLLTTLHELTALAADPHSGVHLTRGRVAARHPLPDPQPAAVTLLPRRRACTADELPDGFVAGVWSTAPLVDMPRHLDYLTARLAEAGCTPERGTVTDLAELAGRCAVVVNCAGLGARALTGDRRLRPLRGQHVIVRNPGLTEFFAELGDHGSAAELGDQEWVCWFPHGDRVVLGGVATADDWNTAPDPRVAEAILARCAAVEPALADAEVLGHLVGLRPDRDPVRLEREDVAGGGVCVHNYGHSGSGVSLSWGCARAAAGLVEDALRTR
jgi:D-amino-acid oxidase